jgi:hypothetical protein
MPNSGSKRLSVFNSVGLPKIRINFEVTSTFLFCGATARGELSYLAPLGSEKSSAPYFKQCFFRGGGGGITPQAESNTTPPSPKT